MALTREERIERRAFIGSSDVPSIAGLYPRRGAHSVWLEKVPQPCRFCESGNMSACPVCGGAGEEPMDDDEEETTAQQVGSLAEPLIAALYTKRTGRKLMRVSPTVMQSHPWARASLDRVGVDGGPPVELKMVGRFMMDAWGEEDDAIPAYYRAQVEWQMRVCGLREIHVAALLGGTAFRMYEIHRDDALNDDLFELVRDFRERFIVPRVAPPVDGSDSAKAFLKRRYPSNDGVIVPASVEALGWVTELRDVKARQKADEGRRSQLEALIKNEIADHDGIEDPRWGKATWKGQDGHIGWKGVAEGLAQRLVVERIASRAGVPPTLDAAALLATIERVSVDRDALAHLPAMRREAEAEVAPIVASLIAENRGESVRVLRESMPKEPKTNRKGRA